ncbi:MAG: palindromic element RPE4 domain-containing protein [Rickettsia sp.]
MSSRGLTTGSSKKY